MQHTQHGKLFFFPFRLWDGVAWLCWTLSPFRSNSNATYNNLRKRRERPDGSRLVGASPARHTPDVEYYIFICGVSLLSTKNPRDPGSPSENSFMEEPKCYAFRRWGWTLDTPKNHLRTWTGFLLLMEEILHHLGCIKPCK